MSDVTNVFNNKKYAIIKDDKVIDSVLISEENVEVMLPTILEMRQTNESIEIIDELSWLGVGCTRVDGIWRPVKSFNSWVWGENGWEPPTPKPEGNYIWNDDMTQWVIVPE